MTVPHQNLALERSFPTLWLDENFSALDATLAAAAGQNILINGAMEFWQQFGAAPAGGPFTGTKYGPDMVRASSVGSTFSFSRQVAGVTDDNPAYYMTFIVTSVAGAANYCLISFPIEGVRRFSGKQLTFSIISNASIDTPIFVEVEQIFGTGGSPSARVQTPVGGATVLSATTQPYTFTFIMPSIAGKTIGNNGDDLSVINVWLDSGSNFNARNNSLGHHSAIFAFYDATLNYGPIVLARNNASSSSIELLKCQRYFYKTFMNEVAPASNLGFDTGELTFPQCVGASVGQSGLGHVRFPVAMYRTPTITTYNPGAAGIQHYTQSVGSWTGTVATASKHCVRTIGISPAGSQSGQNVGIHLTADATLSW